MSKKLEAKKKAVRALKKKMVEMGAPSLKAEIYAKDQEGLAEGMKKGAEMLDSGMLAMDDKEDSDKKKS
jgi:hypothetical protein